MNGTRGSTSLSHDSEFSGMRNLRNPLITPNVEDVNGSSDGVEYGNSSTKDKPAADTNCWRRNCRDPFRRLCWIFSSVSLVVNLGAAALVIYYFAVINNGTVSPNTPPAPESNCSLAAGEELQVIQLNSTTAQLCWATVNVTSPRLTAPYVLHLSDWFTNTSSYVAYSGTNNTKVLPQLIPHVQYNVTLERYTEIGSPPIVTSTNFSLNTDSNAGFVCGGARYKKPFALHILLRACISRCAALPEAFCSACLYRCSSMDDLTFLKVNRETAKKMIQQCLVDSAGIPSLAVPCMVAKGMSTNCSKCWYEEGLCTLGKCFGEYTCGAETRFVRGCLVDSVLIIELLFVLMTRSMLVESPGCRLHKLQ